MKRETIKTIVIAVLAIIVIVGLLYLVILPLYNQKIYSQGVVDGQMAMIRQQMVTGNIALLDSNGTLISKSIVEICGTANQQAG